MPFSTEQGFSSSVSDYGKGLWVRAGPLVGGSTSDSTSMAEGSAEAAVGIFLPLTEKWKELLNAPGFRRFDFFARKSTRTTAAERSPIISTKKARANLKSAPRSESRIFIT